MSSLSTSASALPDALRAAAAADRDEAAERDRAGAVPVGVRIAYLINQYPQASQSFIRREIQALERQGIEVQRYTLRRSGANVVDEADRAEQARTRDVLGAGIATLLGSVIVLAATRPGLFARALWTAVRAGRRNPRGIVVHLVYLVEACVLVRWLAASGAGHVHAHFGTNSTTVAMLCGILGGPGYSFTAHGPEEFDSPGALWLSEKIARARFVIAISEFGRSQLYRWCDLRHWRKIHVVRCGVDEQFLAAEGAGVPREPRLVCVGRLAEQKGQLLLVQAVAKVVASGTDLELVLVGDGPMRREIEGLVGELGIERNVKITGWATGAQVREHLRGSRAMVLPSFAEGLPVVMMEALALHRPVIGTTIAGVPELVKPGVSGWLVPAGDIDALAEAMREAVEAPVELLERMGAAGARAVAERHNVAEESIKLAAIFAVPPALGGRNVRRDGEPHGHEQPVRPFKDEPGRAPAEQQQPAAAQGQPGLRAWVHTGKKG